MIKISIYYDYHEGQQVPIWMFISIRRGNDLWAKKYLYIPVIAPFERKDIDQIPELTIGATVQLDDLTISAHRPGYFGIDIQRIHNRIKQEKRIDPEHIDQFIIQMSDVEELLQLDAVRYYVP